MSMATPSEPNLSTVSSTHVDNFGPLRVVHIAYEVQPDGTLRERGNPPPTPLPPYAGRALPTTSEEDAVETDLLNKPLNTPLPYAGQALTPSPKEDDIEPDVMVEGPSKF
jgi:hypothetical protein